VFPDRFVAGEALDEAITRLVLNQGMHVSLLIILKRFRCRGGHHPRRISSRPLDRVLKRGLEHPVQISPSNSQLWERIISQQLCENVWPTPQRHLANSEILNLCAYRHGGFTAYFGTERVDIVLHMHKQYEHVGIADTECTTCISRRMWSNLPLQGSAVRLSREAHIKGQPRGLCACTKRRVKGRSQLCAV